MPEGDVNIRASYSPIYAGVTLKLRIITYTLIETDFENPVKQKIAQSTQPIRIGKSLYIMDQRKAVVDARYCEVPQTGRMECTNNSQCPCDANCAGCPMVPDRL